MEDIFNSLGAVAVDSDTFAKEVIAKVKEDIEDAEESNETSTEDNGDIKINSYTQADTSGVHDATCIATKQGLEEPVDDMKLGIISRKEENEVNQSLPPGTLSLTPILDSLLKPEENEPTESGVPLSQSRSSTQSEGQSLAFFNTGNETEMERRVRTGEMTPFGNILENDSSTQNRGELNTAVINVSNYLQTQSEMQQQFRDSQRKKRLQVEKKRRKRKHATSSDDETDETEVLKKKNMKDPLQMNVLFPKQVKRSKLGTRSSVNKRDVGKSSGQLLSEQTSFYLSGDSDYVPDEDGDFSDSQFESTLQKGNSKKAPKKKSKKISSRSRSRTHSDSSEYWTDKEESSDRTQKGEYTDDGNFKFYQQRVQKWKEKETRFTSEVHTLEGGFKLPKFIWDSLYNYQKVGVKWLWELHQQRSGGILSDEMGLGKTIQIICFLAGVSCANLLFRFSEFRGLGPSLIICPATVMNQWVQEFHKWWPPFRVGLLHESGSYTGRKEGLIRSINESRGFLITTYTSVVQRQDELMKHKWDYVILDEGHKIRNPDAQITIALKRIPTPRRIILSGSPLQNNLKELWSLFDFVTPGRLGTLPVFLEKFAVPITQGGYANASELQVATAFKCATTLRDIINPYLLRRMKCDVSNHLNLPKKNEQVLFCKLTDEQKAMYQAYLKSDQVKGVIKGEHNLFVSLLNLRKICNHPHLFDGGPNRGFMKQSLKKVGKTPKQRALIFEELDEEDDIELDPNDSFGHWKLSGKMVVVRTLLQVWREQGQKVLLFTQGRQMLCLLEKLLQQENYNYLRLDGGTTIGSRQTLIDKFNNDSSIFVFILTTRVGGLGVNLTGANRVIIFDPDWNPSTDLQARERAWRIGQSREVTIYRLITSGTIEEKMYHRQIFKQFLTNRVLKDPRQKRFFKQNDLMELFNFNDGLRGGTETEILLEGTDSKVSRPRKKGRKISCEEHPRENSRGRFRGVPNLVKQKPHVPENKDGETHAPPETEHTRLTQDDYVLRKLFKKSAVDVALKHDKIMDTTQHDHIFVEKEAEKVAKEAIHFLKKSRQECWEAETGRITWTGANGTPRRPKKSKTKSTAVPEVVPSSSVTAVVENEASFFSNSKLLEDADAWNPNKEPTSAQDLLALIRTRKRNELLVSQGEGEETPDIEDGAEVVPTRMELLADIRSFVAFRGTADGEVTSSELVTEFGPKLPPQDSPLFKEMLKELCTWRQVQGRRVWRLKPEFR